ncbi:leupaxin-like isoform X1 [Convolutriloba macropyga]|uniref:leupaxin-like isoform X1 n=1 Tax=Convolutriloba macropyga TaxID=536237 RepID=UPI003F51C3E1
MAEPSTNHLSELDSLLCELQSATANNAKIIRNDHLFADNFQSKLAATKPPLESLISDLESSIKLNENRAVRPSVSYGEEKPQNKSHFYQYPDSRTQVQETDLDNVISQARISAPVGAGDESEIYDVATVSNSKGKQTGESTTHPEDIYDNAIYDNGFDAYSPQKHTSDVDRNVTNSASRTSHNSDGGFVYSDQTNNHFDRMNVANNALREQTELKWSHEKLNGGLSNDFPSSGDLQECFDAVTHKMASMGIHAPSKGVCEKCGMTIHGQIVTAVGKLWHPSCFCCVLCMKQLAGEDFYERHGEAFCESCYQQSFAPKCHQCNQPIIETFVSALDQNWHPECFACNECHLQLGEGEVSYHEGPDGKAYCSECYSTRAAPKCRGRKCGGQLIHQQFISALGGQWHPECFVCSECNVEFASSGNFFEFEGDPYCELHYHKKRGSLCLRCSQPITGRCITAMGGKRFHPEHFVCVFCMKQLNKGTFKEYKQQPYCHPCFIKLFGGH